VGACADWFAVVALFRHPFGIPIPHTGIVPNNKDRIGAALGRFITNNFLSPRVAHEQLLRVDVVGWITRWVNHPDNAKQLAQYVGTLLPRILKSLARPELGGSRSRKGSASIGTPSAARSRRSPIAASCGPSAAAAPTWKPGGCATRSTRARASPRSSAPPAASQEVGSSPAWSRKPNPTWPGGSPSRRGRR